MHISVDIKTARQIFVLLLLLVLASVPARSETVDAAFTIGVVLPLTGAGADYGDSMVKAIDLAKRDYPENFTHIRFIFEDAAYDAKLAVQAFKKLHEVDKVDLIYVWGVTFCKSTSALAQNFKVPLVAQCIDRTSAKDRPYVVRFMNSTDQYATELLQYLRKKNFKHFGAVLGDNAYAEELFNAFQEQLRADESVTIIDRYAAGQYEMRSTITKIRSSKFDAVGVFLNLGQIAHFYKQRREQNLDFPTFGTNFFESATEIKASAYTMDGAVYPSNSVRTAFVQHFSNEYGKPTQLAYSSLTYEFALLVGDLFNGSRPTTAEEILTRLGEVAPRPGIATGAYRFRNLPEVGRFFEFELTIKTVQGDSIVELTD